MRKIVDRIREGAVIAYPTDSTYALGCRIGDRNAIKRISRIRRTPRKHNYTLVCADLSEISVYARVENWAYRLIKSLIGLARNATTLATSFSNGRRWRIRATPRTW